MSTFHPLVPVRVFVLGCVPFVMESVVPGTLRPRRSELYQRGSGPSKAPHYPQPVGYKM